MKMMFHGCATSPCDANSTQERCFEFDIEEFQNAYEDTLVLPDCGA